MSSRSFTVRPVDGQSLWTPCSVHPGACWYFIMFPNVVLFSKLKVMPCGSSLHTFFCSCSTPFERNRPPLCVMRKVWSCCACTQWHIWLTATSYIKHFQASVVSSMAVVGFWLNYNYTHDPKISFVLYTPKLLYLKTKEANHGVLLQLCLREDNSIPACSLWASQRASERRIKGRGVVIGLRVTCTGACDII